MILTGPSLKLEAVLAGAVSANQPEVTVDYIDWNTQSEATPPATFRTALNSNTDVTILAAAQTTANVGNPVREPIRVAIYNKDTASVTVTVKTDDGTTERIIIKATLLTLESLHWDRANGWYSLDANGNIKQISGVVDITNASSITVKDNKFTLQDDGDITKQGQFQLSGITAGNTRTLTWPDAAGTIALTSSVPAAATQADQETATSTTTYVSPGRQQYHPSAAKAWARYDTGTTIDASYNVSSITDGGSGFSTVNWTTAFSSTSYSMVSSLNFSSGGTTTTTWFLQQLNPQTGSHQVQARDLTGAGTDPSSGKYNVAAFGDQA